MVNADMCEHEWPGSGCPECRKNRTTPPWIWGKELLDRREADPVYDMLVSALTTGAVDRATVERWCIAFWLFYDVGVASWMAERRQGMFWADATDIILKTPNQFCQDGKWPRGGYRRYFRGNVALEAIKYLLREYTDPRSLFDYFYDNASTFDAVHLNVSKIPSYGYTMSFKIADMGERVFGFPISFDQNMRYGDEPEKGIGIAMELFGFTGDNRRPEMVAFVKEHLRGSPVPGLKNRKPNVQEIETVFCEWKHFHGGKYEIGMDGLKIRNRLTGWGDLADTLRKHLP